MTYCLFTSSFFGEYGISILALPEEAAKAAGVLEDVLDRGPFDVLVCNLFAELHDHLMGQYRAALETLRTFSGVHSRG